MSTGARDLGVPGGRPPCLSTAHRDLGIRINRPEVIVTQPSRDWPQETLKYCSQVTGNSQECRLGNRARCGPLIRKSLPRFPMKRFKTADGYPPRAGVNGKH